MAEPVSTILGVIILNAMVSHAVSLGLDTGIVDKFKALLTEDRETRALDTALKAAADKFRLQHPELAEQYFGEKFLKNPAVLAVLTKLLTTTEEVSVQPITEAAWQSTDPVPDEVTQAAEDFLRALRSAISAQEVLAPDYDRRLLAETHVTVAYIAENLRQLRTELHPPDEGGISEPEATALPGLAVREAFGAASSFLLRWPQETGGRWIDRPQLAALKDTILDKPHSVSVVLGAPGCGKSALLAHLGNELRERDVALLALKVDEMPRDVRSATDIAAWLETPGPVDQCVRRLADDQLVVLLIDQLDAVGELIDVHTGRLTALLSLVRRLYATPNVHIVMSCRWFDYKYDVRFRALDAEEVTLGDLPWDDVEEVLRDQGVDPSSWSEPARKVLCTPQHLRLFVDHLADAEDAPAFNSYHSMLEAVFSLRFKGADSQSLVDTLGNIALRIAEYEELWQPRARFDGQYAAIDRLIGLDFLEESTDRKQITFTHQTVFDFVRARAFVRQENSLADYVASKHGSLNIRPTLWSALHYLRSADPQTYRQQLKQVWEMSDLRLHVRLLLISFLGQLPEPDSHEAKLLLPAVDDARLSEKVLLAMGNSSGWFKRLASRLPALMTAEKEVATLTAWLLGRAINFDREAVLDLVEKHWLPDEDRDAITLDVFRDLEDWNDRASAVVEKVVGRKAFQTVWVGIIAEKALKSSPACSARIVRTALDRALREEEARSPKKPIPPPEGASADQEVTYHIERKEVRYGRFEKLLRDHSDWYHLHEWAARYPTEFLAELWPWFVRVVEHLADEPDDFVESYLDSHSIVLDLDLSAEKGERAPVPSGVQAAVIGYAEQAPGEFLEFLRKHQDSDLKPVHMILAQGLEKLVSTHPADCLTYLLGDPRRLALGPFSHQHRDSLALISALYPHLDEADRRDVDNAILAFAYRKKDRPASDAKTRHNRLRWNREHQLRLLRAVPGELMSEPTRRSYEELERALPHTRDKDIEMTKFGWVGSPMSAEQMDKAQDEAILKLFNDLTDESEWDHPKDFMRGGSVQASRAFEGLAKTDPDRVLKLVEKLKPKMHERPVGHALRGLSEGETLPPKTLVDLVHALDARGFSSEEFRWDAAHCLRATAHRMNGLPDKACKMLESWLIPWVPSDEPDDIQTEDDDTTSNEDDRERSVIWGMGSMGVLPHGNYPVLDAIEMGYLCRKPKAVDPWLDVLARRLDCPEDPAVWRALAVDLRFLTNDDPTRASAFLGRLFEEVPSILRCREGTVLLAHVRWWLPKAITWRALTTLLTRPWDQAAQAVGEILFLCRAFNPEDPDYECLMEDVVVGRESRYIADNEQLRLLRLGVAASAANVWKVPEVRELASHTLNRLLLLEDKGLPRMIMDVFRATDRMPEDEHTQRLLQALPHHRECFRHESYSLIEHLKTLLANGAYVEEVCATAETIVAVVGKEIADMRTHWALHGEDLIEIAITLQRFEETRERGLTLFEELMGFEHIYLPKLLQEIDRRIDG